MAGYAGYSMSNNAVQAYSEGKLPLSKISRTKLDEHGILMSVDMFKWLCKSKNIIKHCEWHHTSMDYNETNFYDLNAISEKLKKVDIGQLNNEYKEWKKRQKTKDKDNMICFASVSYDVASGLGKKRKYHRHEDYAVLCNGWAYLVAGGKKKIDGKHFGVTQYFNEQPEQIPESLIADILSKCK